MAKRKRAAEGVSPPVENSGDRHSDVRDSLQDTINKHIVSVNKTMRPLTHAETMLRTGGVALPALCLRYLLHQDAMPLGRTITLSGLFRSNKTSLAFDIARWVLYTNGIGQYLDVEKKDSPDMREALMAYDQTLLRYLTVVPCATQEQWQSAVTSQVRKVHERAEKNNGAMTVPAISIVDSVAAAQPRAESEKFLAEHGGAGQRAHPAIALYNAQWMTSVVHLVNSGPFILVLIQHSSVVQDPSKPGVVTYKQKGGGEMAFAKTTAFEMARVRTLKETASGGGVVIQLTCSKNSLGPAERRIQVPSRWVWVPDPENPGKHRQSYFWDWHHATIDLLLSFETMDGRKQTFKDIKAVCDLHKASLGRVWSRTLGIPESSPVKFSEAGKILEYDHVHLMPALYDILRIKRRPILQPGGDLQSLWRGDVAVQEIPAIVPYPRDAYSGVESEEDADA